MNFTTNAKSVRRKKTDGQRREGADFHFARTAFILNFKMHLQFTNRRKGMRGKSSFDILIILQESRDESCSVTTPHLLALEHFADHVNLYKGHHSTQ